MEQIGKIANQVSVSEQKPSAIDILTPSQKEIISYLWREMTFLYGHRWTCDMGEDHSPNGHLTEIAKRWAASLTGLTRKQIANGIASCAEMLCSARRTNDTNELWPPSYAEFREICKPMPKPYHHPFPKALPRPKASDEIATREIARMRDLLGIKSSGAAGE